MATKKKQLEQVEEERPPMPAVMADNLRTTEILREARKNLDVDALLGENQRLKAKIRQLEAKLKAQGK